MKNILQSTCLVFMCLLFGSSTGSVAPVGEPGINEIWAGAPFVLPSSIATSTLIETGEFGPAAMNCNAFLSNVNCAGPGCPDATVPYSAVNQAAGYPSPIGNAEQGSAGLGNPASRGLDESYTVVIDGNFLVTNPGGAETEGRLAVGGNFQNDKFYGVGESGGGTFVTSATGEYVMVAGGNVTANAFIGMGFNNNGSETARFGGSLGGSSGAVGAAVVEQNVGAGNLNVDIPTIIADMTTISTNAAAATTTGSFTGNTVNGTGAALEVINVAAASLPSGQVSFANIAPGATVVINVSGAAVNINFSPLAGRVNDPGFGSSDQDMLVYNLVWNFFEANSLTINNVSGFFNGMVISPSADLTLRTNLNGRVYLGGDLTHTDNGAGLGGSEIHNYPFTGDLSSFCNNAPVCTVPTANAPTTAMGDCNGTTPNDNATIGFTGIMNADEGGISLGASYGGPAYGSAMNTGVGAGGVISFGSLMHNTQYTVRLFNGDNTCFEDFTITTASINCNGPGGGLSCDCTDYIYLNDEFAGLTHKFSAGATLNEVDGDPVTPGTQSWLNWQTTFPGFTGGNFSPHGLATDPNGNIYIGSFFFGFGSDSYHGIYQFDCDGNALSTPDPYIPTPFPNPGNVTHTGTNFVQFGNYLIHNPNAGNNGAFIGQDTGDPFENWRGTLIISEFCDDTGEPEFNVGQINLGTLFSIGTEQWGLSEGDDGLFYATSTGSNNEEFVFRWDPNTINYNGVNNVPSIDITALVDPLLLPTAGTESTRIQGIDADAAGNVFVYVRGFGAGGGENSGFSGIFKLNPALDQVLASDIFLNQANPTVGPIAGKPGKGRGLAYDGVNNRLYVPGGTASGFSEPDCISVYDVGATSLTYNQPLSVPHVSGQAPKGVTLTTECCASGTATIDQTVCDASNGDVLFLQDFTGCEGSICDGNFAAVGVLTGLTFDDCNNTVTVTDAANACGSFSLTKAAAPGATCPLALNLTINLEFGSPAAVTVTGDQSVCPGDNPTLLTTSTAPATTQYRWQVSTTSATAGFADVVPAATSSTYQPPTFTSASFYRVITTVDGACTGTTMICADTSNVATLSQATNCAMCSITGSIVSQVCSDNNTPNDETDDVYTITVTADIMNGVGTGYDVVDVNGGPNLAVGISGSTTSFTTAADGGTESFFFRVSDEPTCVSPTQTTMMLTECSTPIVPCTITGSIVSQVCSDNNTPNDETDDVYTITVSADIMNGVGTGYDVVSTPSGTLLTTGVSGSTTTFTTAADGGTESFFFRVSDEPSCVSPTQTTITLAECSTPVSTCDLTVDAFNITDCSASTPANTYSLEVTVSYTDAPAGENIQINAIGQGAAQSFAPTMGTAGTETFTLTGLTADGAANVDIAANFVTTSLCRDTLDDAYTSPTTCMSCTAAATGNASDCRDEGTPSDPSDDTFALSVQGNLSGANSGQFIAFYREVGSATETAFAGGPYANGATVFVDLPADGSTQYEVIVRDANTSDFPTCEDIDGPFTAPASCSEQCNYDIELLDASICSNMSYELRVVIAYTNPTTPTVNILVNGLLATTHEWGVDGFQVRPGVDSFVIVNPAVLICGQGMASFDVEVNDANAVDCRASGNFETAPIDPAGYIYCVENGAIVPGGTIQVSGGGETDVSESTGPIVFGTRGNPTPTDGNITNNGTRGTYNWEVTVPGMYTQNYVLPPGYSLVNTRVEAGTLDPTGENDPFSIGSSASGENGDSTFLLDFSEAGNVYYQSFDLQVGDPFIINNNVPLMSSADITAVTFNVGDCNPPDGNFDVPYSQVTVEVAHTGVPNGEELTVEALNGSPLDGSVKSTTVITPDGASASSTRITVFTFNMRADGSEVDFVARFAPSDCSNDMEAAATTLPVDCCPDEADYTICNDETNSVTLTAPAGLSDVEWFDQTGASLGMGISLEINSSTGNFELDTLRVTYTATDDANSDCPIELCCPLVIERVGCVSIGSTVWADTGAGANTNNGMLDVDEMGINGVSVVLQFLGADGVVGGGDDVFVDTLITMGAGTEMGGYIFDGLAPGNYRVLVPANLNMQPGGPLNMAGNPLTLSSVPTNSIDSEIDNDDNGIQMMGAGTDVFSPIIMLAVGDEPVNGGGVNDETGSGSSLDPDDFDSSGDMTIDFGFAAEVIDVALTKVVADVGGNGPTAIASLGDDVTFTITVENQSTIALNSISVVDYIADAYTFNAGDQTATGWALPAAPGDQATYTFDFTAGGGMPLAPGATAMVDIVLELTGGAVTPSDYTNIAEVTNIVDNQGNVRNNDPSDDSVIDPTPDPNNDPGGVLNGESDDVTQGDGTGMQGVDDADGDEDDADPAAPRVIDAALIKVVDPASFAGGGNDNTVQSDELIQFDISVTNQGNDTIYNPVVYDDIPCGLDWRISPDLGGSGAIDLMGEDNDRWTAIDSIPPPGGFSFHVITGVVDTLEGFLAPGQTITLPLYLRVRSSGAIATVCGAEGTPNAEALNNSAEIASLQYEEGGTYEEMDFDSNFDENDDTEDGGGVPNGNSDNVVTGDGSGVDPSDDPLTDDDDEDGANNNLVDVALVKVIDTLTSGSGPYSIGDPIKFDILLINQGDVEVNDVDVIDYLPAGLMFDAAANTMAAAGVTWTAAGSNYTATFAGPIAAGDTSTISIFTTILASANDPNEDYLNEAEITAIDAQIFDFVSMTTTEIMDLMQDADSPLNDDPDDQQEVEPNGPDDNNSLGGGPTMQEDFDNSDIALVDVAQLTLGSTVFLDLNNNGMQDAGEMAIPNVPIILFDETNGVALDPGSDGVLNAGGDDGINDPYFTDMNGNYFFQNLPPGDYSIRIPASAFDPGGPLADFPISSNATTSGFMEQDPDGTDVADPADDVDGDDNGTQAGGEGTEITSGIITLSVGDEPTGAQEGGQGGDQDDMAPFVDASGNMTLDLGVFAPVSVGDTTFVDVNGDGQQDAGDLPLANVTVTIIDVVTGLPVDTDAEGNPYNPIRMTDATGAYLFDSLPPGNYQVQFDITNADNSEFFIYTMPNMGDDATDSDAAPTLPGDQVASSDETGFLNSGENDLTLDAGVACNIIVTVADPSTICSTRTIDLTTGASITPAGLGGNWTSSGNGTYDDQNDGVFGSATTYTLGSEDIARGSVTLTLTTSQPPAATGCEPVSASVTIEILRVDCGTFPWGGQ